MVPVNPCSESFQDRLNRRRRAEYFHSIAHRSVVFQFKLSFIIFDVVVSKLNLLWFWTWHTCNNMYLQLFCTLYDWLWSHFQTWEILTVLNPYWRRQFCGMSIYYTSIYNNDDGHVWIHMKKCSCHMQKDHAHTYKHAHRQTSHDNFGVNIHRKSCETLRFKPRITAYTSHPQTWDGKQTAKY